MGYVAWQKALHLGWYRARWKLRQSVRGAGGGFLYPFRDARFLARFLAPRVDRYSKWRAVSQVTSHEAASACTDQFKIKVRNNESAIMILNFFSMVEQAYALAWKQAFHLEISWKEHARAARERRRGSEGWAKKESSPFSPMPPNPRRSLARSFSARFARPNGELALRQLTPSSKVQCLFPILVNGGGLKPGATAPGKFDG